MIKKKVLPGIDVFLNGEHSYLGGRKIALLSNYSATNYDLISSIDLLTNRPEFKISVLIAAEHGLWGHYQAGENVPVQIDRRTGLKIHSLYNQEDHSFQMVSEGIDERMRKFDISDSGKKINESVLEDIDIIIFDLQDVGTRIYTYISTMGYLMSSISGKDKRLIILDRPNPITGIHIEGPILKYPEFSSFVGFYSIPIRHGMTIGELSLMFNKELFQNKVNLSIVKNENWKREYWFDQTGLNWVNPSPNIPTLNTAIVYPGMVFLEGTNISEGRGTTTPFEIFGAPWIDGKAITDKLNGENLTGVIFRETLFIPSFSKYSGEKCSGSKLFITDRESFCPFKTSLHIISVIKELHPKNIIFHKEYFDMIAGNSEILTMITSGVKVNDIIESYITELSEFNSNCNQYFMY